MFSYSIFCAFTSHYSKALSLRERYYFCNRLDNIFTTIINHQVRLGHCNRPLLYTHYTSYKRSISSRSRYSIKIFGNVFKSYKNKIILLGEGILYYNKPRLDKLYEPSVWSTLPFRSSIQFGVDLE